MSYVVSLYLTAKPCLVIGGGRVAARKANHLIEAGAAVTVISPSLHDSFPPKTFKHIADTYKPEAMLEMVPRPFLVFAATDDAAVNQAVAADAQSIGALVNVVDNSAHSDFDNMMTVNKPPITVAVSTAGTSPALGKHLRDAISDLIGDAYPTLAQWMGDLRLQVIAALPEQQQRRDFWHQILQSDVLALLKNEQINDANERFNQLVKQVIGERE